MRAIAVLVLCFGIVPAAEAAGDECHYRQSPSRSGASDSLRKNGSLQEFRGAANCGRRLGPTVDDPSVMLSTHQRH